jgi:hypothetical protein
VIAEPSKSNKQHHHHKKHRKHHDDDEGENYRSDYRSKGNHDERHHDW